MVWLLNTLTDDELASIAAGRAAIRNGRDATAGICYPTKSGRKPHDFRWTRQSRPHADGALGLLLTQGRHDRIAGVHAMARIFLNHSSGNNAKERLRWTWTSSTAA